MTVASSTSKSGPYAGNGVTTVFAFAFKVQQAADIKVVRTVTTNGTAVDTTLTSGADYTVAVNADQSASPGGNVTILSAPANGQQITILRNVTATQGTSIPNQGGFYPRVVEAALDKLTMLVQQLSEESGRALKVSVADSITNLQDLLLALNTAVATATSAESAATAGAEVATEGASTATAQANIAIAQATAAATAVASIGFRDVLFLSAANSPYTISQATSGCLLNIDTSAGNVVVNLPTISGLSLPYTVGVKKATSDANTITLNRGGADLFDDGTTASILGAVSGVTLVPDTDTNPDKWTVIGWGGTSLAQSNTWTGMQTFRDNKFEITDEVDSTKKLTFQLSGISAGQSRSFNAPDKSGTLALLDDIQSSVVHVARTANTQIVAANRTNLIDITSGTFTQTFASAATLGDGWYCWLRNSGSGSVTLDPNGSETIDGMTSFVMYSGEMRLIQCDGTALRSVVINAFKLTGTISGTFIKPPGYLAFTIKAIGAGAGGSGGGGASGNSDQFNPSAGGGGGPGGMCGVTSMKTVEADLMPATVTYTVGSGGTGGTGGNGTASNGTGATGGSGTSGGATTFGLSTSAAYLTALGGSANGNGGTGSTNNSTAGSGNTASGSTTSSSIDSKTAITCPNTAGANGSNGALGSGSGGTGGAGGNGAPSSAAPTAPAGGAAKLGPASTAGLDGNDGTAGDIGQGGGGGSGGSGAGTGNPPAKAGGKGGNGGNGGSGQLTITGII
jgi:hypothetical protein